MVFFSDFLPKYEENKLKDLMRFIYYIPANLFK